MGANGIAMARLRQGRNNRTALQRLRMPPTNGIGLRPLLSRMGCQHNMFLGDFLLIHAAPAPLKRSASPFNVYFVITRTGRYADGNVPWRFRFFLA